MLVDSHCHLDRLDLSPFDGSLARVISAANERGVSRMLCVGIDMDNAQQVMKIADDYTGVYASVGVHPMDIEEPGFGDDEQAQLKAWAANPKVVAIGETGLDYYYSDSFVAQQQDSFKRHLQLSSELAKPVIVHTRNAQQDTLECIRRYGDSRVAGVLHCFTETWEMAKQALEMNYFISFSGIITFKNAGELREVVKNVPLDRMLVETDSPYLAPVPYRGKKNVPQYVVEVAQCVAEIKDVSYQQVVEQTTANFDRLFFSQA